MSGLPSGAVTFLFTDIEGSTRLVKALRDRYPQVLAEHRRLVRAAVAGQAGHEVDTQGDAFFVAFASAKQAVLCSLEVQRALAGHPWPDGAPVRVRIGIHTGQAVPTEGIYTGLAVHRAARICAVARGGQVLVSQTTQSIIEDEEEEKGFTLVDFGEHRLKDLERPVRLFQLSAPGLDVPAGLAAAPRADGSRGGTAPEWVRPSLPMRWSNPNQQPPFVGRRDDLAVIANSWTAVAAGAGRAVFVGGEPGAGKSRLVAETAQAMYGKQATVLVGSCVAELGAPFEPFDEPVRALLPAIRQGQISLEDWGASAGEPPLALLSAVAGRRDAETAAADKGGRRELYDAVVAAFRGAAAQAPLVLVLEDLQWAGAAAVQLLRYLLERTTESRILVLATHRNSAPDRSRPLDEAIAALHPLDGVRRLNLSPLTTDDVVEYLSSQVSFPEREVRRAAARLREQTGGNPFFLRELWRDLAGHGGLGSIHLAALAAPESVKDALERRLDLLTAEHQEVIELAAVLGEKFDSIELLAVSPQTTDTVLAAVDAGVGLGILEQTAGADGCFQFLHAIARQVLLDRISPSRLTREHVRIAEELEANFPAAERRVQRLAHHYACGRALGYVDQAVRYLVEAAKIADRNLAHEDAARLYERAASITTLPQQRDDLRLQAARCCLLAADFAHARDLDEQVVAAGGPRQRLRAAIGYEIASFRPGLTGHRAVDLLTEALRGVPHDPTDVLYVRGIASLGRAVAFTGARDQAHELTKDAIGMARSLGDKALLASTLDASLFHPYRPGDVAARLNIAEELTQLAGQSGDPAHIGPAAYFRGRASYTMGDVAGLDRCEADLAKASRELGGDYWDYFIGCIRYARQFADGDLGAALRTCSRLVEVGGSFGTDDTEGPYGVQMYMVQREAGRLDAVRPLITGYESPTERWAPGLLALYTELGLVAPTRQLLQWLLERYTETDPDSGDWPIRLVFMVEAATWLEDEPTARRLRPLMADYAGLNLLGGSFIAVFGSADRYLGRLDSLLGTGSPEDRFAAAFDLDVRTEAPLHQAETLAAHAAHLQRIGKDTAKARQLTEQALSIAEPRGLRRITGMLAAHGGEGHRAQGRSDS